MTEESVAVAVDVTVSVPEAEAESVELSVAVLVAAESVAVEDAVVLLDAVLDAERLVELAGTSDVVGTPMMSVATVPRPPTRLLTPPPRFAPRSPRAAPVSAATVRQHAIF